MTVLPLVELNEIGASIVELADVDGDREHRLRHREEVGGAPRALRGQDEAGHVGAGLRRDGHVLVASQATNLDQWPRGELGQLGCRIAGTHQRRTDEDRVRARQLGCGALGAGGDPTLGDDDAVVGGFRDQLELGGAIDVEGREIAGVDADRVGIELDGALQFIRIVSLDERIDS